MGGSEGLATATMMVVSWFSSRPMPPGLSRGLCQTLIQLSISLWSPGQRHNREKCRSDQKHSERVPAGRGSELENVGVMNMRVKFKKWL